jgi:hypothetical protein
MAGWMRDQEKLRSHLSPRRRGGVARNCLTTPPRPSATPPPAEEGSPDPPLPTRLFEGGDQRFLPKDVPQFIQAFQQTGSREAVDLKLRANGAEFQGLLT